jgi:hypothetical protein
MDNLEKYFDYNGVSPDCSDNSEKNTLTTLSSTSSTTSTLTAAHHARGLVVAYLRKLSVTLGGSTSTHPGVRKLILKTYDFDDIGNTAKTSNARGLDNNSTTSTSSTTAAPTAAHPTKAKFSSSRSQLSFIFTTPDARGLRCEQSSCISLTSNKKL